MNRHYVAALHQLGALDQLFVHSQAIAHWLILVTRTLFQVLPSAEGVAGSAGLRNIQVNLAVHINLLSRDISIVRIEDDPVGACGRVADIHHCARIPDQLLNDGHRGYQLKGRTAHGLGGGGRAYPALERLLSLKNIGYAIDHICNGLSVFAHDRVTYRGKALGYPVVHRVPGGVAAVVNRQAQPAASSVGQLLRRQGDGKGGIFQLVGAQDGIGSLGLSREIIVCQLPGRVPGIVILRGVAVLEVGILLYAFLLLIVVDSLVLHIYIEAAVFQLLGQLLRGLGSGGFAHQILVQRGGIQHDPEAILLGKIIGVQGIAAVGLLRGLHLHGLRVCHVVSRQAAGSGVFKGQVHRHHIKGFKGDVPKLRSGEHRAHLAHHAAGGLLHRLPAVLDGIEDLGAALPVLGKAVQGNRLCLRDGDLLCLQGKAAHIREAVHEVLFPQLPGFRGLDAPLFAVLGIPEDMGQVQGIDCPFLLGLRYRGFRHCGFRNRGFRSFCFLRRGNRGFGHGCGRCGLRHSGSLRGLRYRRRGLGHLVDVCILGRGRLLCHCHLAPVLVLRRESDGQVRAQQDKTQHGTGKPPP